MNKKKSVMVAVFVSLIASGCASSPEKSWFGGDRVNSASANQLFTPEFEVFSDEKLFSMLDPKGNLLKKEFSTLSESAKIKYLNEAFLEANNSTNATALRAQIQDRVIAASDQRCNLYMTYLKRVSTYENGIFGTLTTILGGAGAIVTGENSARVLSGLAGISSGTRAELNQALFESVATSIITPGIEKARSEFLVEIMNKRKDTPFAISVYTIQGAIADAIKYHGLCSMDAGINAAQKSLQAPDDVGVQKLIKALEYYEAARSKLFPKLAK